jgi:hypothetical protein
VRGYLTLGSTPAAEECVQVGDDNYYLKTINECKLYIEQLKRQFGDQPGCRFTVKGFLHDFGQYHEVVVYFDDEDEHSVDFVYNVENNLPEYWDEQSKLSLSLSA